MISLGSAYGEIQIGTEGAAQSVQSLASTLQSFGTTMSLAVSAPLIGAATVALKSAGDFEQSMNMIQAAQNATASQMAQMQSAALQWGAETVFSAGEVAQGMLELTKNGFDTNEVMAAMPGVMDLASASGLDLAQAGIITANALHAFGLDASKSTTIANMLAAAANSSSLEVTDLQMSFAASASVAHQFGMSAEELAAALTRMGDQGIKGSDSGTALKTMMQRLMAPTKEAKKALDNLGVSIYDGEGKMRSYSDIMSDLQQALYGTTQATVVTGGRTKEQTAQMKHYAQVIAQTKQKLADYQAGVAGVAQSEDAKRVSIDRLNRTLDAAQAKYNELAGIQGTTTTVARQLTDAEREAIKQILFGTDGIRAANVLLPDFADANKKAMGAVTEQGAAAKMADARMKGFNGAIEYIKGSIDSFMISTALPFLDSFGGIIRKVGDAITAFGALPEPVKNAALTFLAVMAAAGPAAMALSGIIAVVGALLSPLGLITLAVAVLAAAWVGDWGGIQEKTFAAWATIQTVFAEAVAWLQTNIPIALAYLQAWWASVWPQLAAIVMPVWTQISNAITTAWTSIQPTFNLIYTWLQTNIPAALTAAQTWFAATWAAIPGVIATAWATIQATFTLVYTWLSINIPVALAYLQATWGAAWGAIAPWVSTAWGVIQPVLSQVYAWLVSNIPTSLAQFQALWGAAWTTANTEVTAAWGAIQAAFNSIYSFVTVSIPLGVLYLQAIWSSVWASISATTSATIGTITATWSTLTAAWGALAAFFGPSIANLTSSFSGMVAQFGTMGPQFQALWAAAQPVLAQLGMAAAVIGALFSAYIAGYAVAAINTLAAIFRSLPAIVGVVVAQMTAVLTLISTTVSNVVAMVSAILAGNWSAAWASAQAIMSGFVTFIQSTLLNNLAMAGLLMSVVGSAITTTLSNLGFEAAATSVQNFINKIISLAAWIASLGSGGVDIAIAEPEWMSKMLAWVWPALPAWTWPTYLAFTWPAYVDWVWSDYPTWSWPTLPPWKWPSFPSWTWPSIPAPDWLDALLNAVGLGSGNAGGTSYAYGQGSAINERGRELISIPADQTILPPGSRVYTNGQSNRMLDADTGTGLTINFYGTVVQNDMDIHRLANKLGSLVRKQRP